MQKTVRRGLRPKKSFCTSLQIIGKLKFLAGVAFLLPQFFLWPNKEELSLVLTLTRGVILMMLEFTPEIRDIARDCAVKISKILPQNPDLTCWEINQMYVESAYDFAKAIDPNYKTWREKDETYVVDQQTEKYLIKFYEAINNKSPSQLVTIFD